MLQVFVSLNLMLLAMVNSQLHMRNMWQKRGQSSNSMGYVPTNQWKKLLERSRNLTVPIKLYQGVEQG